MVSSLLHFPAFSYRFCWFYISFTSLITLGLSFTSTRTQIIGQMYNHVYPHFHLLDYLQQSDHKSLISSLNYQILINLFRSLPKRKPSIQVVSLPGAGIFQLILLTLPNNFNNKVIIIKENPNQYILMNKNLYLNGLQQQAKLYNLILGRKNSVSHEGMGERDWRFGVGIFYKNKNCDSCVSQYRIETNISVLIQLQGGVEEKKDQKYLEVFVEIISRQSGKILNIQLLELVKTFKIQLILSLKTQIPLRMLLFNLIISSKQTDQIKMFKIYEIKLKINNKKSSLQFTQILYNLNDPDAQQMQQEIILNEGIYYITQNHLFFTQQ